MGQENQIVALSPSQGVSELGLAADPVERLLRAFVQEHGRSPHTLKSYLADLDAFAGYCRLPRVAMVKALLQSQPGAAYNKVREYRQWMGSTPATAEGRPLASGTINRRLATLRTLARLGRMIGVINWSLEVPNIPAELRRDTKGPTLEQTRALFAAAADQREEVKAVRDVAILRLLFDLGLRASELLDLDFEHYDRTGRCLKVKGKGKRERVSVAVPEATAGALAKWVEFRGSRPGPLFFSLKREYGGQVRRISRQAFWKVIRQLGERAGIRLWPHALRHTSITLVTRTKGLAAAQAHARHANPGTTSRYVDEKGKLAAEAAVEVSKLVQTER